MQLRSHRGSSVCIKAGLEQILHRLRWWIVLQVLHRRLVALYLITYLITVADKTLCLQTYKRSAWYAGLGPYTKLPFAPNKRQIVNMLRNLDDRLSCKTRIKCYAQVKHYSGGLPPRYIWKLGTVQKGGPVITSSDEIGEAIPFEVVGTVLGTSTESLTQVLQRPRFGWPLAFVFAIAAYA